MFLPTYLPYFFRTVTGNKQFLFLGLIYTESLIIHSGLISAQFKLFQSPIGEPLELQ